MANKIGEFTFSWGTATPRERWYAFYRIYRLSGGRQPEGSPAYDALRILIPVNGTLGKMMHCVRAEEYSWLDLPLGTMLRRVKFDKWKDPGLVERKLLEMLGKR